MPTPQEHFARIRTAPMGERPPTIPGPAYVAALEIDKPIYKKNPDNIEPDDTELRARIVVLEGKVNDLIAALVAATVECNETPPGITLTIPDIPDPI